MLSDMQKNAAITIAKEIFIAVLEKSAPVGTAWSVERVNLMGDAFSALVKKTGEAFKILE